MKKNILLFIIGIILFTGCQSKNYTRDTSKGIREFITLSQVDEKIANKDNFIVVFAQSTCYDCANFNTMVKSYIEKHNIAVYEVILDFEETSTEENKAIIAKNFDGFDNTPGIYYVENGKQVNHLVPDSSGLSEEQFDQWVVKYRIDEKK